MPFGDGPPERMLSQTYRAAFDVQWEIDVFGRLQCLTASYLNAIALYKALGRGSGGADQAQSADKPLASN